MASEIFVVTSSRHLIAINPLNLSVREVGETSAMFSDIAFGPNGKLYGITFSGLYEIDPSNASTQYIGSLGVSGANALEVDSAGNAYLASANNGNLYSLDLSTGDTKKIGTYSDNAESEGDLSLFDGKLYLTTNNNCIVQIDPETGVEISSVLISVSDMYGLEQLGSTLYGFARSTFYSVDPDTGRLTIMQNVSGYSDFNGAASFDFSDVDTDGVVLIGTSSRDWLFGNDGNDQLSGVEGDDFLYGYNGADTLNGGTGKDFLDGGKGADVMRGGTGADTYIVDNTKDRVIEKINEGIDIVRASVSHTLTANVENLTLTGTQAINGTGNTLSNSIKGNSNSNKINGGGGNDTLLGGGGNDTISGGPDGDRLDGGAGHDTLKGNSGNDKLAGRSGSDHLYGGSGSDMFIYKSESDSTLTFFDRIVDFSRIQRDRVDLRGIDADSTTVGNQAFTFIGTKSMSGIAGELRWEKVKSGVWALGDTDGDGDYDFAVHFDGLPLLAKGDFLL